MALILSAYGKIDALFSRGTSWLSSEQQYQDSAAKSCCVTLASSERKVQAVNESVAPGQDDH